jgi:hypothetical protein
LTVLGVVGIARRKPCRGGITTTVVQRIAQLGCTSRFPLCETRTQA